MNNEFPSYEELNKMPDHEILIMVVGSLHSMGINLCNHLKHHEDREKEDRKYYRSLKIIAISAIITSCSSLIIGLILLIIKCFI